MTHSFGGLRFFFGVGNRSCFGALFSGGVIALFSGVRSGFAFGLSSINITVQIGAARPKKYAAPFSWPKQLIRQLPA